MRPLQYAVVAYVNSAVGEFVENLRSELSPEQAHLPAHITALPPRTLNGDEEEARERLQRLCREVQPFEVELGEVATFMPTTPTVFIRVERAAYKMRELHDRLNVNALCTHEQWPYMPHLTIVKMNTMEQAQEALRIARDRWSNYRGETTVQIQELTFVREGEANHWVDLAHLPLGTGITTLR